MDWKREGGRMVFPTNTYLVIINKWERTESFKKKTPQIKWTAEIIEPEAHKGREITEYTVLTQAALWKIAKLVAACGVDTSKLSTMDTSSPSFDSVLNACLNRKVGFYVVEKTGDDGSIFNDVSEYRLVEEEIVEPLIDEDIEWK